MSKFTHVKSAHQRTKGPQHTCWDCKKPIEVGQSYTSYQADRFSRKWTWHATCSQPKPSALESNEKRSQAMAAFEDAQDALASLRNDFDAADTESAANLPSDLETLLQELGSALEEVAQMWEESAQNIEDGFQHETEKSNEMREYGEQVQAAADELQNWTSNDPTPPEEDDDEAGEDSLEARILEWAEGLFQEADNAIDTAEGEMP